jgi:hypothetical protein
MEPSVSHPVKVTVRLTAEAAEVAEGLLAELGAGNYGETADKLRRVAAGTVSPENRADLLMIAESFDRLARKEGGGPALSRRSSPNPRAARSLRKVA